MANEENIKKTPKKKRNSNFSKEEVVRMVEEYGQRINIFNFGTRETRKTSWEEITQQVNTLHPEFERSVEEIKKKWVDTLYATKKEFIAASPSSGKGMTEKLSDISELIVNVRGGFTKKPKRRKESGVQIINLKLQNCDADGSSGQPTIYIPHVDECSDSGSVITDMPESEEQKVTYSSVEAENVESAEAVDVAASFHDYNYNTPPVQSQQCSERCTCGLTEDLIRLKQEKIEVMKRMMHMEEDRRIEEKQKWWEEKTILRLKRQKLELEIKQMQKLHK